MADIVVVEVSDEPDLDVETSETVVQVETVAPSAPMTAVELPTAQAGVELSPTEGFVEVRVPVASTIAMPVPIAPTVVEVQVPAPVPALLPDALAYPVVEIQIPGAQGSKGDKGDTGERGPSPIWVGSTPPDDPVTYPLWVDTS